MKSALRVIGRLVLSPVHSPLSYSVVSQTVAHTGDIRVLCLPLWIRPFLTLRAAPQVGQFDIRYQQTTETIATLAIIITFVALPYFIPKPLLRLIRFKGAVFGSTYEVSRRQAIDNYLKNRMPVFPTIKVVDMFTSSYACVILRKVLALASTFYTVNYFDKVAINFLKLKYEFIAIRLVLLNLLIRLVEELKIAILNFTLLIDCN